MTHSKTSLAGGLKAQLSSSAGTVAGGAVDCAPDTSVSVCVALALNTIRYQKHSS
jgi:hypothetical protein